MRPAQFPGVNAVGISSAPVLPLPRQPAVLLLCARTSAEARSSPGLAVRSATTWSTHPSSPASIHRIRAP